MRNRTTTARFGRAAFAVGFALLLGACGSALTESPDANPDPTTTPPPSSTSTAVPELGSTTSAPPAVTTSPPTVVRDPATVPDLVGMTLADARKLLSQSHLDLLAVPGDVDSAIVSAQEPAAGIEVGTGTVVTVEAQVIPTCNPPDPIAPGTGQVTITVLFECGNDFTTPSPGVGVARIVPEQGGEAIDRIEWTLRSLLVGPTADERAVGFVSFFGSSTAAALNSVTLRAGHVVADFNEAIMVNNMSTSTGGIFFNAELRRSLFQHPEVETVELRLNGSCEAWSGMFESDGCWVHSRSDWYQDLSQWDELRSR